MRMLFVYSIIFVASRFFILDSFAFSSSPAGVGRRRLVRVSERYHRLQKTKPWNDGARPTASCNSRLLAVQSSNNDEMSNRSNQSVLDAIKKFGRQLLILAILSIICVVGDVGPAHARMWINHNKSNTNDDSKSKVIFTTKQKSSHLGWSIPIITNNNKLAHSNKSFFSRLKESNGREGNPDAPSTKKISRRKPTKLERNQKDKSGAQEIISKHAVIKQRLKDQVGQIIYLFRSVIRRIMHQTHKVTAILKDYTKPFVDRMNAITATIIKKWNLLFHASIRIMNLCLHSRPVRLVTVAALASGAGSIVGYRMGVSKIDNSRNQTTTTTTTTTTTSKEQQPPPSKGAIPSKVQLIRTDNNNSSILPPSPTPNTKSKSTTVSTSDEKKKISISLKKMNDEERLEIAIRELKRAQRRQDSIRNNGQSFKDIVQTGLQRSRVDRLRDWWNKP